MMDHVLKPSGLVSKKRANNMLKIAIQSWFCVAVLGQWFFAIYMTAFYGGTAATGNWTEWNMVLKNGIVEGDMTGNVALASHILLGTIITVGGPLQLIPSLRNRFPRFHHWNGRLFIVSAILIGIAGIYLNLTRENQSGTLFAIGNSVNGFLMIVFAVLAVRYAIARNIKVHRVWALRLFIMANGVWFSRVMMMAWFIIAGGPVGIDPETFQGPFVTFLAFAHFMIPLALLELYLFVHKGGTPAAHLSLAAAFFVITLIMLAGIAGASMFLWLPLLEA